MSIVSVYGSLNRPSYLPQSECPELSEAVDAVYTWVNGSDPEFLRSLEETDLGLETHSLDTSPQRYEGLLHSFFYLIMRFESIEIRNFRLQSIKIFFTIHRNVCPLDSQDFYCNKWSNTELAQVRESKSRCNTAFRNIPTAVRFANIQFKSNRVAFASNPRS